MGFFISFRVLGFWNELFLATQRNKDKPKYFKDINILLQHIINNYPTVQNVRIHLDRKND